MLITKRRIILETRRQQLLAGLRAGGALEMTVTVLRFTFPTETAGESMCLVITSVPKIIGHWFRWADSRADYKEPYRGECINKSENKS